MDIRHIKNNGDKMKKILGLWSGHDASFCILKNGLVEIHTEAERHLREKEPQYDSIKLFYDHFGDTSNLIGLATCHRDHGIKAHKESWEKISLLGLPLYVVGHHQAHAANAFFSSKFENSAILTVDGGGIENEQNFTTGVTIWSGKGNKIEALKYIPLTEVNIGGVWSRTTRHIFGYESGWPQGNQCGTTMALAALAKNPEKYTDDFRSFMTSKLLDATSRAPGHVVGMSVKDPKNPRHPFLDRWKQIADSDPQEKYNMAGALQLVTEEILKKIITETLELNANIEYLCISGGVALNSVAMGKIYDWFPSLKGVYIPPVPYDGGLTIGAAQYAWHHILDNPRITWADNASPYLGQRYSKTQVEEALSLYVSKQQINVTGADDDNVLDMLEAGKIISVFNDKAESGRRALGNRSILADPRDPKMKDRVNDRVKHRQWFRPFAPSVILDEVTRLFVTSHESPYMGFVLKFKDEIKDKLPAIVHFDGTARLQTVTENDNPWYYKFIKRWGERSGFSIILNTSFNDREPICETPHDAVKCFLGTEIDALYFPEFGFLVTKK